MQVTLHPYRWGREVMERVQYRLVFSTNVDGNKVQFPIVPNPASSGNLGEDFPVWIREVALVGPSRGGFPESEELLYLRLLQERYRRV